MVNDGLVSSCLRLTEAREMRHGLTALRGTSYLLPELGASESN